MIELLVAGTLGVLASGLLLTAMSSNRDLLGKDLARTALNQNLRGALDIVGTDIRVGGENLSSSFPAIELLDGGAVGDELIVRRNLRDEILPVCVQIDSGTSSSIIFALPGTVAGCIYSGQTHSFDIWQQYRAEQPGAETLAYIFNSATKQGEFFRYVGESDTGTTYAIQRDGGSWTNTYPVGSSAVFLLEEWRYRLQGETLELIENGATAAPFSVSFGITRFEVTIELRDGSTRVDFLPSDDWSEIASISVSLAGVESYRAKQVERVLASTFFPRNVLSN